MSAVDAGPVTPDSDEAAYHAEVRLAGAMRRMIQAAARLEVPEEGIDDLVGQVDELAARLERHGGEGRFGGPGAFSALFEDPGRAMAMNPVIGHCSAIAPPVEMTLANGEVTGRAHLGRAYIGPPGRVHGGWVCAVLDQLLGFACIAAEVPGYTASITVHLRNATPLDTDLELVARVTEVSGKRVRAWGSITAAGVLTAEAEGLFIRVLPPTDRRDDGTAGPPAHAVDPHDGPDDAGG